MRLEGRTAIVTGGGSGIGRASALLFAKQGAFVALVDRDPAGLQETMAAIRDRKSEASMHVGDVGDSDFAQSTVGDILARTGRLDVLMTSAGFSCRGPGVTTAPAYWAAGVLNEVDAPWPTAHIVIA